MAKRLLVAGAGAIGAYVAASWLARRRRAIDLAGRSVVITGGSRGLGLLIARALVGHGARLALLARSRDDLERARAELVAAGGDVLVIPCDVGDRASLESAIGEVAARRGRIDVLINNAGIIQVGPFEHMSEADYAEAMQVHFWAPLHAMVAVVPLMRKQGGGRIVNVSSLGGKVAVPHLAPYCASKFALTGLSDALRAELARDHIRVTTVIPATMRTGSHVNVDVRGRHRGEFTWFALGASAPLLSQDAERAARRIVRAARLGDREVVIGLPARALILADALAPGLVAAAMALANRLMPAPTGSDGDVPRSGWDSRSLAAPSALTRRGDRAVIDNNELRGHDAVELGRR